MAISRKEAVAKLWEMGNLQWKLDSTQKDLYSSFADHTNKTIIWACSRRLGKTRTLCIIALEVCLKTANSIVKFVSPQQKQVRSNIRPLIRDIISDCPAYLKPKYHTQDGVWRFPNGSEIQIAGTDNGNAEGLRGGNAHLCLVDEAGSCAELEYLVQSILLPTMTTTDGKIILASTPPLNSDHAFVRYMQKAELDGTLMKKTIRDNPRLTPEKIDEYIKEVAGDDPDPYNNVAVLREYFCVDENTPIKTKLGYKKIKDIEIGDEVFTHKGRYRKVLNKFKNAVGNRDVYKIKCSNNLSHIVTEGHRLYVKTPNRYEMDTALPDWKKVEDIHPTDYNRAYFQVPIEYRNEDYTDIDKAYLAGWYVAEGNCATVAQQIVLTLNHKDPIHLIQESAKAVFGKEFKNYTKHENHGQWALNSKAAKEYFGQFGKGAANKKVIDELKYGTIEVKRAFLDAYFNGDGWDTGYSLNAASISLGLLADISDMLLSLGIACQITKVHSAGKSVILERSVNLHDSYALRISGRHYQKYKGQKETKRAVHFIKDGIFNSRIKSIKKIENYGKEFVYDIEIEEDHSYVGLHGVFHNCEVITDRTRAVVPEWSSTLETQIVTEWQRPPFRHYYVSMDIGFKDMTVALFGYYDFRNDKIVIENEVVMNGREMTTEVLAEAIKKAERDSFLDSSTNEPVKAYMRIADNNNLVLLNDLHRLHGLLFIPTLKDDKAAALNQMRMRLGGGHIIIHPRCKTLIFHLKNAIWNKARTSYERSEDQGHFDAVDALVYLVRNIHYTLNPYPANYDMPKGQFFDSGFYGEPELNSISKHFKDLYTVRSSLKRKRQH